MEILAALQFDIRACVPVCGYTLPPVADYDDGKGDEVENAVQNVMSSNTAGK